MSALGGGAPLTRKRAADVSYVGVLILARVATVGGATRAEVAADLAPLFTHKLSPQEWRRLAEKEIGQLVATNHVAEAGNRLSANAAGAAAAARFFGQRSLPDVSWPEVRDLLLIAKDCGR
jgi:type II secretory pathway component PulL